VLPEPLLVERKLERQLAQRVVRQAVQQAVREIAPLEPTQALLEELGQTDLFLLAAADCFVLRLRHQQGLLIANN
jgi:hypothetical protein